MSTATATATAPTPATVAPKHTPASLLALDDEAFSRAVTADLNVVGRFGSVFLEPAVYERTIHALTERFWYVDAIIEKSATNPNCDATRFRRMQGFRRHLLATLDLAEQRSSRGKDRLMRMWRATLHEVCEELEGGEDDNILDFVKIPFNDGMTLRAWLEIRRLKDPERVAQKDAERE